MSVKKFLAVFVAALILFVLAYPEEASCGYGLFSQRKKLQGLRLLQEMKNIIEGLQSAYQTEDTERYEGLVKELEEKVERLKDLRKEQKLQEQEIQKEQIENHKPNFIGIG